MITFLKALMTCKSIKKDFTKVKQSELVYVNKADNFAVLMRKIAAILILIFALVLLGPAVQAMISTDEISLFIVDEEKNSSKGEIKEIKKDYSLSSHSLMVLPDNSLDYFTLTEHLYVSPVLDNLTPPPNEF